MIKVKRVSDEFLWDYLVEGGMYKWTSNEQGQIIHKGIYLNKDAGAYTLLHEFIHYLLHLLKFPKSLLELIDIPMHLEWWASNRGKKIEQTFEEK